MRRIPFFIDLTIVLTTGNGEGEAEQLLSEGWETIEMSYYQILGYVHDRRNRVNTDYSSSLFLKNTSLSSGNLRDFSLNILSRRSIKM